MFSKIFDPTRIIILTSISLITLSSQQAKAFTIYMEDFDDPADQGQGAIGVNSSTPPVIDTSGVDWTIDINDASLTASSDFFRVQNNQFEAQDVDGEAIWSSPIIDISSFSDVSFSLDFSELLGNLEETGSTNADYVDVTYIVDGTSITIPNQNGVVGEPNVGQHTLLGDFGSQTISQTGLSGNDLQLNVAIRNSAGDELISFDNVLVEEVPWEFSPNLGLLLVGAIFSGNHLRRKKKAKLNKNC